MKKVLSLVCVAALGVAFAAETAAPAKPVKELTPQEKAERAHKMHERFMRFTGGRVRQPGSGMGVFVFANFQKRVEAKELEAMAKGVADNNQLDTKVVPLEGKMKPAEVQKKVGSNMVVMLVDCDECPDMMTLAPESGWAIVNVNALAKDAPDAAKLAKRTRIECIRAFAMLMGGVGSQYQGNMMDPIRQPKDLEGYLEELPVDVIGKFKLFGIPYGVKPYREANYREAVREGWADKPANEYQKACLEIVEQERAKAKTAPAKPMPIKFDPKKGE